MRATKRILLLAAVAASVAAFSAAPAPAQDGQRRPTPQADSVRASSAAEISSQARRRGRPATRLRVHRDRLPPNAVRSCDAWYVQEFRPSGPVIVPRMRCRWIAG